MARSYLTPTALPANPASTLHVATKQYADALDPVNLVGADDVFAYYYSNAAQTGANNTDAWISFGGSQDTNALITQTTASPGHKFTLGTTGIWAVTVSARWVSGGGTGERYLGLWSDVSGSEDVIQAWGGVGASGSPTTMTVSLVGKFTSGNYVTGRVYQASGGNLDLENGWSHILISLVRKLT